MMLKGKEMIAPFLLNKQIAVSVVSKLIPR